MSLAYSLRVFEYWSSFFFNYYQNSLISLSFAAIISLNASFCSFIALDSDSHS